MYNTPSPFLSLLFLLFVVALPSSLTVVDGQRNARPVVGVLTQPTDSVFSPLGKSYLPASYVKWLEAAGAKVVPVPWDATEEVLKEVFDTVNGLLFPGGNINLPGSVYQKNSYFLYNLTLNANDDGDYFPLWGTCQGFEQLLIMTSGNDSILEKFNSEDLSLPLTFASFAKQSNIFRDIPPLLWDTFSTEPVCENLHSLGISPEGFKLSTLVDFYDVVAVSKDRDGKDFVSVMESKDYPVFGTQWHPERNQFEWDESEPIDTSLESIECVAYLANFFVEQCRKNTHTWNKVVYDLTPLHPVTYTSSVDPYYVQTYFWN